jgi:hypothetical protein
MRSPDEPPIEWPSELQEKLLEYIYEQIDVRTPRCFEDLFEYLSEALEDDVDFQGFDVSAIAIETNIRIVCSVGLQCLLMRTN